MKSKIQNGLSPNGYFIADDFLIQYGQITSYSTGGWQSGVTVTFGKPFRSTYYYFNYSNGWNQNASGQSQAVRSRTTTSIVLAGFTSYNESNPGTWYAVGPK